MQVKLVTTWANLFYSAKALKTLPNGAIQFNASAVIKRKYKFHQRANIVKLPEGGRYKNRSGNTRSSFLEDAHLPSSRTISELYFMIRTMPRNCDYRAVTFERLDDVDSNVYRWSEFL